MLATDYMEAAGQMLSTRTGRPRQAKMKDHP